MKLLDGTSLASQMRRVLISDIHELGFSPGLGVVLVGNNPASQIYVDLKEKAAKEIGVSVQKKVFAETATEEEILQTITTFNRDPAIQGVLVQLPLPEHLDTDAIIRAIYPEKDVDGFHPENEEKFLKGEGGLFPVFPRAIFELAKFSGEELSGKHAMIVANSDRFGEMMVCIFDRVAVSAEYGLFHALSAPETENRLRQADILVTASGKPGSITGDHIKPGAIVIDGGIAKIGSKVVGDVDRASTESLQGFLSPVPGGVGPVTIACLLANVVEAARRRK